MPKSAELAAVIGQNAKKAREGTDATLDQFASAARTRGLKWTESRAADFEAGRVAPTLPTLIGVCLALADLGSKTSNLRALVNHDEPVPITEALSLNGAELNCVFNGDVTRIANESRKPTEYKLAYFITQPDGHEVPLVEWFGARSKKQTRDWIASHLGATESRVRRSLNVSDDVLVPLLASTFQRTFAEERDERAGRSASAQERGRVSRKMLEELRIALATARNGHGQ